MWGLKRRPQRELAAFSIPEIRRFCGKQRDDRYAEVPSPSDATVLTTRREATDAPTPPAAHHAWLDTVGQISRLPVSISYGLPPALLIGRNTLPARSAASIAAALVSGAKVRDFT